MSRGDVLSYTKMTKKSESSTIIALDICITNLGHFASRSRISIGRRPGLLGMALHL